MSLANSQEHLCLRIPVPLSFLLQALSLCMVFVGNAVIICSLLDFLVRKVFCALAWQFCSSCALERPNVLEWLDFPVRSAWEDWYKCHDEAFFHRPTEKVWLCAGPVAPGCKGRICFPVACHSVPWSLLTRSVLWPRFFLSSCAGGLFAGWQVCWGNPAGSGLSIKWEKE